MSCGLPWPQADRWVELPGDPAPLRAELAARRREHDHGGNPEPEPPKEQQ